MTALPFTEVTTWRKAYWVYRFLIICWGFLGLSLILPLSAASTCVAFRISDPMMCSGWWMLFIPDLTKAASTASLVYWKWPETFEPEWEAWLFFAPIYNLPTVVFAIIAGKTLHLIEKKAFGLWAVRGGMVGLTLALRASTLIAASRPPPFERFCTTSVDCRSAQAVG